MVGSAGARKSLPRAYTDATGTGAVPPEHGVAEHADLAAYWDGELKMMVIVACFEGLIMPI